jgi:hypothetical protein
MRRPAMAQCENMETKASLSQSRQHPAMKVKLLSEMSVISQQWGTNVYCCGFRINVSNMAQGRKSALYVPYSCYRRADFPSKISTLFTSNLAVSNLHLLLLIEVSESWVIRQLLAASLWHFCFVRKNTPLSI